jgi:hypothetical protein
MHMFKNQLINLQKNVIFYDCVLKLSDCVVLLPCRVLINLVIDFWFVRLDSVCTARRKLISKLSLKFGFSVSHLTSSRFIRDLETSRVVL